MGALRATIERPRPRIDRYEVLGVLGTGGMARVLRVRDRTGGPVRAMKVPAPGRSSPRIARRLQIEAYATEAAAHPNVPALIDFGFDRSTAEPFLVLELATRGSLGDALRAGRRFLPDQVAALGVQVLAALDVAHAHGVVHRDVKPGNVLLVGMDRALLGDWGIARVESHPLPTRPGALLGSPAFMAPEQREDPDAVGPASDLFAVGSTLWALATGRAPDDDLAGLPAADPAWDVLPPALRGIVVRATRPDPAERFPSARAMAAALARSATPRLWPTQPHLRQWLDGSSVVPSGA